jgi:hypothetical protein
MVQSATTSTGIGWYCIELTTRINLLGAMNLWNFPTQDVEVNSKIYLLNKSPIPDGQSLSVDNWTEYDYGGNDWKDVILPAGIYWFRKTNQ